MVLPMNSGAEAVETAWKIARKWGYEKVIKKYFDLFNYFRKEYLIIKL